MPPVQSGKRPSGCLWGVMVYQDLPRSMLLAGIDELSDDEPFPECSAHIAFHSVAQNSPSSG